METMFEFMLFQMVQAKSEPCNKLEPFVIIADVNRIQGWTYELTGM